MGETTNNSTFFLRKFLEVLDAVALGTVDAKISSRRRISVNTKPSNQNEEQITEGRKLDINSSVINGLRDASPVEPGRVLEF